MTTTQTVQWFNRGFTFFLAAAAAACAVFWVLQWPMPSAPRLDMVAVNAPDAIDARKVAQLLGDRTISAPGSTTSNIVEHTTFKLIGIIAIGHRNGSALMATDTLPAKPYRVGDRVSDKLVLQSVSVRSVVLAEGVDAPAGITLKLPDSPGLN